MSALGQKQTSAHVRVMSALPPKADIGTGLLPPTPRDRSARRRQHCRWLPRDKLRIELSNLETTLTELRSIIAAERAQVIDLPAWLSPSRTN
jgi:hypothetical protein